MHHFEISDKEFWSLYIDKTRPNLQHPWTPRSKRVKSDLGPVTGLRNRALTHTHKPTLKAVCQAPWKHVLQPPANTRLLQTEVYIFCVHLFLYKSYPGPYTCFSFQGSVPKVPSHSDCIIFYCFWLVFFTVSVKAKFCIFFTSSFIQIPQWLFLIQWSECPGKWGGRDIMGFTQPNTD